MNSNSFEVPTIPTIFVPHNQPNKSESPKVRKISKSSPTLSNSEKEVSHKESNPPPLPPPPQLCASCSQILLSYFVPLQQYVNEVVELARTQQGTSPPALKLPNNVSDAQTSNQTNVVNEVSYQTNESIAVQQQQPSNNWQNERGQSESHSYESRNTTINNESANQWNVNVDTNYQNQSHNQTQNNDNQNQSHENRASSYGNQNEGNINENRNEERTQSNESHSQSHRSQTEHSFINSHRNDNQTTETTAENTNDNQRRGSNEPTVTSADNYNDNSSHDSVKASSNAVNETEPSNASQTYASERETSRSEIVSISSPYAFVTIAYNNLSATNAIILANSLLLTNNKSMSYTDDSGNKSIIQVPFVIVLGGSIDPVLKDAIFMVFDEVISQPMDVRVALLNDESFGIQQYKLQLWKELQNYKKCLYLESSTMVVGKVCNLFEECEELSACVDWLFPDNFNCSVFVFEPNMTTYEQIISFARMSLQIQDNLTKCSAQKDESLAETLDEMTLLNQFFAHKWKRISFIYNFVRNDAVYTQIPAFMKFGDSIRIVNFGHMMSNQSSSLGNQSGSSSVQPWHIMFDLLASNQRDVIKTTSIDNYSKFYLNCFIKRLWPIIQTHLTPLLVTKYGVGRREWSIFELIRLLSNESGMETDDHMFTQTPITLRRIKSPAEKMAEYDNLSIEDEILSETMITSDDLSEADSESRETISDQNSVREQTEEEIVEELVIEEPMSPQQQDERSKKEWEAGRIDWMGAHQSDRIINRLKKLIRND